MSTHMAPLPTSLPFGAARAASTRQQTTARGVRGKRPTGGMAEEAGHHPGRKPNDHLCTCGKLREECVRDRVRALWA